MESFSDQLRQVLRRLGRAPIFTIITVITLAAGVGANIAVFSVVEGVLLKPLPYPHAETLVAVQHTAPGLNMDEVGMAPSNYQWQILVMHNLDLTALPTSNPGNSATKNPWAQNTMFITIETETKR